MKDTHTMPMADELPAGTTKVSGLDTGITTTEIADAPAPESLGLDEKGVQELADSTLASLGWTQPAKKAAPKEPTPDKAAEEAAAKKAADEAAAAKKAEDEAAAKKVVVKKAAPAVDPVKIAQDAADRAVEAAARKNAPPTAEPHPEKPVITEQESNDLEVIRKLEEINPEYAGYGKRVQEFYDKTLLPYRAKWEQENPGKEFDADAAEHKDVYARQPEIDPDDFEKAQRKWEVAKEVERIVKPKQDEERRAKAEQALMPVVQQETSKAIQELVQEAAPELVELLKGENPLQAMQEADPVAAGILDYAAKRIRATNVEINRLMTPELGVQLDIAKNPLHAAIVEHVQQYEAGIQGMPAEQQVWNGRQFATVEEYSKMAPKDQGRHWTVTLQDLKVWLPKTIAAEAKQAIVTETERVEKAAAKRGWTKSGTPPKTAPATETPPGTAARVEPKPVPAVAKPAPPNTSSGADKITTPQTDVPVNTDFAQKVVQGLFG